MGSDNFNPLAAAYRDAVNHPLKRLVGLPEDFTYYKARLLERLCHEWRVETARSTCLELGCGSGYALAYLQGQFHRLIGMDLSVEMLRYAPTPGLYRCCGDATALPFQSSSTDLIFSIGLFHHSHGTHPAILAECLRLLRPGGYLISFEHNPQHPVTRYLVRNCPIDADAVLVSAPALREAHQVAGFRILDVRYCLFLSPRWRWLHQVEHRLKDWPIGTQYAVLAQAPC